MLSCSSTILCRSRIHASYSLFNNASGTKEGVAKKVAEAAGADLFEIKPEVPYTNADLNWMDKKARSTVEMNDPSSRPATTGTVENMEQYDNVIIGFPKMEYSL